MPPSGMHKYARQKRKSNKQASKNNRQTKISKSSHSKAKGDAFNVAEDNRDPPVILREFDLEYKFGPCVGIGRLERWKRAKALGLDPPEIVREILEKNSLEEDICVFERYKGLI